MSSNESLRCVLDPTCKGKSHRLAYSQLGYPKGWSNEKEIAKDYFGFVLHLLS